jgi:Ser/Thr protein kinase RdoA (MazF antagonist)
LSSHRHRTEEPVAIDPILEQAIATLLPDLGSLEPVGNRPFLVLGTRGQQDVRIRRWPDGTVQERVRFIHRLQELLRAEPPVLCARPVPDTAISRAWTVIDGKLVDVQEWLPGRAAQSRTKAQEEDGHTVHRPAPLEAAQHATLVRHVASCHARSSSLATSRNAPHASLEQVLRAIDQTWSATRVRLRPTAPTSPPIQRWLRLSEQVIPAAKESARALEQEPMRMAVAHLSLWPGHVLIDRDDNVSLLDFGAAVSTVPLLDVAQLVTRFAGWTGDNAEQVLGQYADVRPLTPHERRALPAVAGLDLIIESARLLRIGYAGAARQSSREAVSARAGALDMLNSLEAVLPAVVRGDAPPVSFVKRQKLAAIKRSASSNEAKKATADKKPGGPRKRKS